MSTTNGGGVLFIAMHYPPYRKGSGYLRTLKFTEYLPDNGWQPTVLSMDLRGYREGEVEPDAQMPRGVQVIRPFALDTSRHLSIKGRYLRFMALPDRWVSWWPAAVWRALQIVKAQRPKAIISTFPIATAHMIGATVARLSGLPWVADFRDPMLDETYPRDPWERRTRARLEKRVFERAAAVTVTTAATQAWYDAEYPHFKPREIALIRNGYDESDFIQLSAPLEAQQQPLTLVHSGVLYPDVRNPSAMYQALSELRAEGVVVPGKLEVKLRAVGPEQHHQRLVEESQLQSIVKILPPLPYHEALDEMQQADGLLLLQGAQANRQVPAKLFEYMRCGRPILGLIDPEGESAAIMHEHGIGVSARLDDPREIKEVLRQFVIDPTRRTAWSTPLHVAELYSRSAAAAQLAQLLERITQV